MSDYFLAEIFCARYGVKIEKTRNSHANEACTIYAPVTALLDYIIRRAITALLKKDGSLIKNFRPRDVGMPAAKETSIN